MLLAIRVIAIEQQMKTNVMIIIDWMFRLVTQGIYTARLSPPRLMHRRKIEANPGWFNCLVVVVACGLITIHKRRNPMKPVIQVGKTIVKVLPMIMPVTHRVMSDKTTLYSAVVNLHWLIIKRRAISVSVLIPIKSITNKSIFNKILTSFFNLSKGH